MATQLALPKLTSYIPDETLNELSAMANRWKLDYIRLGHITLKIIDWVEKDEGQNLGFGVMDVYRAVASALNNEISERTVRYYTDVVKFFDLEIFEAYELLPFSHFAFAKSFDGKAFDVLDLAYSYTKTYGKAPSVAWLSVNFGNVTPDELNESLGEGSDRIDFLRDQSNGLGGGQDYSGPQNQVFILVDRLKTAISVESENLKPSEKAKLKSELQEIVDLLQVDLLVDSML